MTVEEAKKRGDACIYCLEFPNGMRYIGKTKNIRERIGLYERFEDCSNRHLRSVVDNYGFNSADVTLLTTLECSDAIDLELSLSLLEIKYIREMNTVYPNGLNVSLGGEVLGIPIEYLATDKDLVKSRLTGSKVVLVYDLEGRFVEEYPSIARLAYDKGVDEDCVRSSIGKMTPFRDKWFLRFKRYDYVPKEIEVPKVEIRERVRYKNVVKERIVERVRTNYAYIPALRYDMNGDFCGEYPSKAAACRVFLKNKTCNWAEYHNGYILFKKRGDDYPKKIEPYYVLNKKVLNEYYTPADELSDKEVLKTIVGKDSVRRPLCVDGKYTNIKLQFRIGQYTLQGELVREFDSIRDAASETGIAYSQIYACVKGSTKKASGYKWAKIEE